MQWVRAEIQNMINMDIIEPSESLDASSIVVAKMSYFCNLNKVTIFFLPWTNARFV